MADFKNPFIYGGRVSGDAFCNREREIQELLEDIRGRQHVILSSQRRFGKTSLVWKILEEIRKEGIIPVYVDLYPISTLGEFIEEYAKAIARALSMYEKAIRLMRELFSRLHLSMGIDTAGNPQWSVGFDRSRESETFDEVVSSMENYLKRKGKYGVVVFDEFQQITETNGEKTERRLRSAIQTHEHLCYLFVGSKRHLLHDLFSNPNRPFYRSGKIFPLEKIDIGHLQRFIKKRFNEAGVDIDQKTLELIVETTECHPYYTQYLCHILYDIMENRQIRTDDVTMAIDLLLRRESTAYMNTWDLLAHRQRQALVALSETGPGESPFRPEILRRFNISQPAVMIRALRSLVDKDLVDREGSQYSIIDLFFKRWIKTCISTGSQGSHL
jgi:AAA+ ATPase superfamily predicted ATPase